MSANAPGSPFPGDPGLLGSVPILRPEQFGPATGSDGTSTIQSAINAAAAIAQFNAGLVDVALTPGSVYNWGGLTPKNGVRIWAYGAVINPILSEIGAGLLNAWTPNVPLSMFEVRGGLWLGTGLETQNQSLFLSGNSASGAATIDVKFIDLYVTNWNTNVIGIGNPQRARVQGCVILNPGDGGAGVNAINFITRDLASAASECYALENVIEGAIAAAIAYVEQRSAGSGAVRVIFARNITSGSVVNGTNPRASGALLIEFDKATGGPWTDFQLTDNMVNNPNLTAGAYALSTGAPGQKITVRGGMLRSTGIGVLLSNALANPNGLDIALDARIDAPTPITLQNGVTYNGGSNKFTTGPSRGRAVLVAGTATVNTTEVQAGDSIFLTRVVAGGTVGVPQVGAIVAGTSFVINSVQPGTVSTLQGADTSTIYWEIRH